MDKSRSLSIFAALFNLFRKIIHKKTTLLACPHSTTTNHYICDGEWVSEWGREMCIICNACAYFSHKWKCFSCFSSRNIDDDDDDEHQIRLSSFECPIDNLCLMCMIKSVCVCSLCSLHACLLFIRLLFGQFHHKSFRCSQECSFFWRFFALLLR